MVPSWVRAGGGALPTRSVRVRTHGEGHRPHHRFEPLPRLPAHGGKGLERRTTEAAGEGLNRRRGLEPSLSIRTLADPHSRPRTRIGTSPPASGPPAVALPQRLQAQRPDQPRAVLRRHEPLALGPHLREPVIQPEPRGHVLVVRRGDEGEPGNPRPLSESSPSHIRGPRRVGRAPPRGSAVGRLLGPGQGSYGQLETSITVNTRIAGADCPFDSRFSPSMRHLAPSSTQSPLTEGAKCPKPPT